MNFKSFGNEAGGGGGRQAGNFSLTRQPSVYSLTFDEFMNSMGGSGKDFGSMNMDELLKNIWTAEEVQTMASAGVAADDGGAGVSHLQRQGSLTLPRTLSQKTVDEVWKDISKDHGGPNLAQTQREPTLGEVTLEEFLVRAGVVREDAKPNESVFVDLSRVGNNSGLGLGFQQRNKVAAATGLMGNRLNNDPLVGLQPSANLPLNVNGVRTSNQQPQMQSPQSQHQHQHQHQQQQQQIFPKQSTDMAAGGGNIKVKDIFAKESGDASMIGYFKSLGLDENYVAPSDDERIVVIKQFEVIFQDGTEPIVLKFETPAEIEAAKKQVVNIKEGCFFKFRVTFRVQHEIVLGFKIHSKVSKMSTTVAKDTEMLGTYPPSVEFKTVEVPRNDWTEAPSGAMARGEYKSVMIFTDDDQEKTKKAPHLKFEYKLKIGK